jgi:predicted component of type VI protein secretion system
MRIHNTIGLSGIISKYLQTNTSIKSFVPQWLNQETTVYLGKNTCLGDNIILGDKILDASSKIIITIGPIDLIKGYTLLPKQPAAKKLHRLLQSYLPAVITYDICLTIITATKDFILGSQYGLLGFVSWLGQMKENYYNVQFSRSAVES